MSVHGRFESLKPSRTPTHAFSSALYTSAQAVKLTERTDGVLPRDGCVGDGLSVFESCGLPRRDILSALDN